MKTLESILRDLRDALVERALHELHEARLFHYERDREQTYARMAQLFDAALRCIAEGAADAVVEHADRIARERFEGGYDLGEVQTSINIMEEVLIARVVASEPPDRVAGSLCVINTIFSMTKDTLARAYVSLAGKQRVVEVPHP
jgi:negative regulator of replication initiation